MNANFPVQSLPLPADGSYVVGDMPIPHWLWNHIAGGSVKDEHSLRPTGYLEIRGVRVTTKKPYGSLIERKWLAAQFR